MWGPALGHLSPLLQLLGSSLDMQVPSEGWESWHGRASLGLVFGEGGEELLFPWSFPRPVLHFEMEQTQLHG